MINVLLVYGGGGAEHEVSERSALFIASQIPKDLFNVISCEITKSNQWLINKAPCSLGFDRKLTGDGINQEIHVAIPCIHGPPGETGEIQSFFELIKLPYFGCGPEANSLCFNKISTKLWFDNLGINNTPYEFITSIDQLEKAKLFQAEHSNVFVKSASQGSSVGCYPANTEEELIIAINKAFQYSSSVLIEKSVQARELEVAAFEYQGALHISPPGEIIVSDKFYSYEEKYSEDSHSRTITVATDLPDNIKALILENAQQAFEGLKLRHLSRIDFFYTSNNQLYLNEINTFPGHTKISMFPKMLENTGLSYSEYISSHLKALTRS